MTGCKSSAPSISPLPNGSGCTHNSQCRSGKCCGNLGHNAVCASSCKDPTPSTDFCASGERPMLVTNNSSQTIWVGITGGTFFCTKDEDCSGAGSKCIITDTVKNTGNCGCTKEKQTCGTLGDCATNSALEDGFKCFWKHPRLVDATDPKLAPKQSLKLCFPAAGSQLQSLPHHQAKATVAQWSGNLFARFGCDSNGQNCLSGECSASSAFCNSGCEVGQNCGGIEGKVGLVCLSGATPASPEKTCTQTKCGPGFTVPSGKTYAEVCPNNGGCAPQDGNCNVGTGGTQPTTLAEFTFQLSPSTDFYDVSIINGINIGISMAPDPASTNLSSTDPYFCATPGSKTQSDPLNILRDCSWKVDVSNIPIISSDQKTLLRQVEKPTALCDQKDGVCCTEGSCPSGQVCGLAQNAHKTLLFARVCGKFVAYWTANQIATTVGAENSNAGPIDPIPTAQADVEQFGCTGEAGKVSCYQDVQTCDCGCPTLSTPEVPNLHLGIWPNVLTSQKNCKATNKTWIQNIEPWLVFMKKACPTAYTFPFDDKTSTFTCSAKGGTIESGGPGYFVTFFDLN